MDILKLLSRSTKQTNKSTQGHNKSNAPLPSSGVNANPQLYHDAVPGARGTKRKRAGADPDDGKKDDDGDIDFFAQKTAAPKSKAAKNAASDSPVSKPQPPQEVPSSASPLDEDECRQVLKSHRVKVTILPSPKIPEQKVKKSKKAKVVAEVDTKPEFKQIFPQPLEAYSDLGSTYGIHGRLRDNLEEQGYKIPTEVQMGSLPLLLNPGIALANTPDEVSSDEIDLLAVAPTGSGKTLAFLIPVANQILQRRRTREDRSEHILEAVIVAPTKELASQIVSEAKKLCLGTGIKVTGMRKGMRVVGNTQDEPVEETKEDGSEDSASEAEKTTAKQPPTTKVDILVTTPGLLLSSLTEKTGVSQIPTVRTLVLDEADVLLDPLFRDQTLGIWTACTNSSLRVTLWSATMGSNIEELALSTINTRRTTLDLNDSTPTIRLVVGLKDSAIPNITHTLTYTATEPGKLLALRQLLQPTSSSSSNTPSLRPPFLIFTQTIPRAIALHSELLYDIPPSAGGSSRLAVLHSNLADDARAEVMRKFRSGEVWILITTDILSRGVDFKGVNGVVNYDVPNSAASYIHRVGRTGRAGRDGGVAVTFYTKEDIPFVKGIANVIAISEKQGGKLGEGEGLQKWLLDALPNVGKEKKKNLKLHGVEARRDTKSASAATATGQDQGDGKKDKKTKKMLISTKSGYERKIENKKRGAIEGSKRRVKLYGDGEKTDRRRGEEPAFGGFED